MLSGKATCELSQFFIFFHINLLPRLGSLLASRVFGSVLSYASVPIKHAFSMLKIVYGSLES